MTTALVPMNPLRAALTRRLMLKAAGLGGLALAGLDLPGAARADGVGGGWTHVVGGGGGLLFYNANSGTAIVGTLDGNGFVQNESHDDFAPGINLVVCTSQGSVLYIDTNSGAGGTGSIAGGYWTAANGYDGFASNWTHAVASADSALLYDANSGQGLSGTLQNGEWTYLFDYTDFATGFTHLFASDDTLLFYNESSGLDATGTLTGGGWQFTFEYDSFSPGWGTGVAGGDSLLLVADGGGAGLAGTLAGGAWSSGGDYDGFGAWTHGASAGNGYAALYDANSGAGVWGTLGGGVWSYAADLAGEAADYGNAAVPTDDGNAEAPTDDGNGEAPADDGNSEAPTDDGNAEAPTDEEATPDEGDGGNGNDETIVGPPVDGSTAGVDQTGLLDSPALDQLAQDAITAATVPGLSVAIAKDGRLIFAKGYGVADRTTGDPVTTGSRFRIASVSKPLTAAAVLALVEQGRLQLTDHVFGDGALLGTSYGSPPYAPALTRITVTYLLEHTAGGWTNDDQDPMFQETSLSAIDLISWTLTNRPLDHEPGTHYAYSNFGYCILGRVIEQVTGKTYADAVQELILGPSGVTAMQIAGNTLAERAANEVVYDGTNVADGTDPYSINVARMDAHGGWIATAVDVLRFAERVDGLATVTDLLSAATIARMTTPSPANPVDRDPGYAMGWNVNAFGNWWHRGNLPGTEAFLVRAADGHDWMAVANGTGIDLETLGWKMVDAITDTPPGQPL